MTKADRKVIPVELPGLLPFTVIIGGWWANLVTRIAGHMMTTIRSTVYVRGGHVPDVEGIAHEYAHVEQWHRLGVLRFLVVYYAEQVRRGYAGNLLECEAKTYARAYSATFADWGANA